MKKLLIAPLAVAALALAGFVPSASGPATVKGEDMATVAATANCKSLTALSTVHVRKSASTRSTSLRLWYKGTKGCDIKGVDGGSYRNTCGIDSYHYWRKVNYRGTVGYVPNVCVKYS
ncbi:hypothetical protein SUDANB1_05934 [Streptomyces sp. enrichment culture]|uniref:hypothetical protein n=1 Tax=Streptomyces collinus TaxID=42684 RepID=UPI00369CE840